jgi:hypothetical protein
MSGSSAGVKARRATSFVVSRPGLSRPGVRFSVPVMAEVFTGVRTGFGRSPGCPGCPSQSGNDFEQEGAEVTETGLDAPPRRAGVASITPCEMPFPPPSGREWISHSNLACFSHQLTCPVPLGQWRENLAPPLYRRVFPPRRERRLFPAGNPSPPGNSCPVGYDFGRGTIRKILDRIFVDATRL